MLVKTLGLCDVCNIAKHFPKIISILEIVQTVVIISFFAAGCDALDFVCRDGEGKAHLKYCDEYYFCVRGKYELKKCVYPDRWSIEHGQSVSCGERIPKNHPCKC